MRQSLLVKVLLVAISAGLGFLLFSAINDSPTSDEPPHLLSGYAALKYGQNHIDLEHPLLAKVVAATPLLITKPEINFNDPSYLLQEEELDVGKLFKTSREWLSYSGNNPDHLLFAGRIPMIIVTIVFGLVLFLLARKLFGVLAGIIAFFLYATEPLILANGSLINTDIAATGTVMATIFALYLYSEKPTSKRLLFLAFALSAAILSKFSTFYLVPIVLLSMEYTYRSEKKFARVHMFYLVASLVVSISAFYGILAFRSHSLAGFIPYIWGEGFVRVLLQVSDSERFSYLLGEGYYGARWYYFPVLLVTKLQLVTLAGFLIGLFLIYKQKIKLTKKQAVIVFLPALIFLLAALVNKLNIGVRHVLPLYPFIILTASAGLAASFQLVRDRVRINLWAISAVLVIALLAGRGWSLVTTYPHWLSYYNFIGGGTDNGWKISNDSNYDWGQDIKRLGEYVKENNIETIALDNYSGYYAAEMYQIPFTISSPKNTGYKGYLAISTSALTYHEDRTDNYSWVTDNYQPITRAGKSIFIYKIE